MQQETRSWSQIASQVAGSLSAVLPGSDDILLLRACLDRGEAGRKACEACLAMYENTENGLSPGLLKWSLPLLFRAVRLHGVQTAQSALTLLKTAAFREELRAVTYRRICRRVLRTLVDSDIPSVVIEGAALGEVVYPDANLRHSHDIELLLPDGDLDQALRLLCAQGFAPAAGLIESHEAVQLLHESGLPLRLHGKLFHRASDRAALQAVLARTETTVVADLPARVLSPMDALLLTCDLAFRQQSRLRYQWVVDTWFIIERHPDLHWNQLLATAAATRLELPVSIALAFLSQALTAPIPSDVLDRIYIIAKSRGSGESVGTRRHSTCKDKAG